MPRARRNLLEAIQKHANARSDVKLVANLKNTIKQFAEGDEGEVIDLFDTLINISVHDHVYLKQWAEASWEISTVNNLVKVIENFELVDLELHGKAVWTLYKILHHSLHDHAFVEVLGHDNLLLHKIIEVVLRLAICQPIYSLCISILRLLVTSYHVPPDKIFAVGVALPSEYFPVNVEDNNMVALICYADWCSKRTTSAATGAVQFILRLINLVMCDLKSNYFLCNHMHLFEIGLSWTNKDSKDTENHRIFGDTIVLLRCLASMHPGNCQEIARTKSIMKAPLEYLLNRDIHNENGTIAMYEMVCRESILLINAIASIDAYGKSLMKSLLPISALQKLASYEYPLLFDVLVDLYITLFEDSLTYCDVELRYVLDHHHEDASFLNQISQTLLDRLEQFEQQEDSETVIYIDYLYRGIYQLERTLRLASDIRMFIAMKKRIVQLFTKMLGSNPTTWNLRYAKMLDILVLMIKGAEKCWQFAPIEGVDRGFLQISNQLVEQFVSLSSEKIFDAKDRNSLNYLAGSDDETTIQSIIAKNCDDEMNSNLSISSTNMKLSLESSGSLSRSPKQFAPIALMSSLPKQQPSSSSSSSTATPAADDNNITSSPPSPLVKDSEENINSLLEISCKLVADLMNELSNLNHLVSDWVLESVLVNYRRLSYLYLMTSLLTAEKVDPFLQQSQHIKDLLWNILNDDRSNGTEMFNKFDIDRKCIQCLTLFLDFETDEVTIDANNNIVIPNKVSTDNSSSNNKGSSAVSSNVAKPPFGSTVAFNEYLVKILTSRPGLLQKQRRKRYQELKDHEKILQQQRDSQDKRSSHGSGGGDSEGSQDPRGDRGSGGSDGFSDSGERDRMSMAGNFVLRPSAFINSVNIAENPKQLEEEEEERLRHEDISIITAKYVWKEYIVDDFSHHYVAVNALVQLSQSDRVVRRKLVATCASIIETMYYIAPMDNINQKPMLHLIKNMVEFIPKLELVGEEAIVGLVIRSITSPLHYLQTQACDLIFAIGQECPGFIFRGISRREIEDPLLQIFLVHHQAACSSSGAASSHNKAKSCPILLLSALKACTVIVHNFNIKPVWLPSPWLYHWQYYQPIISTRDLMTVKGLTIIISVLKHADIPFRLPFFMYTLSLTSSLMYAFSDGIINPSDKHDIMQMKNLKDLLIQNTLPWLPIAIDFIILGKKKRRLVDNNASNKEGGRSASPAVDSVKRSPGSSNNGSSGNIRNKEETLHRFYETEEGNMLSYLYINLADSPPSVSTTQPSIAATPSTPRGGKDNSGSSTAVVDPNAIVVCFDNMYKIKAIEKLTEKTLEAIYAFLCTDDMFPLSTYLQNIHLFQANSLIAAVSYFMTEYKDNSLILRRGLDFMRYFSDYQMNISSIAMHAPLALVSAYTLLKDVIDVQLSFVKIVLVIVKTHDEFAKENLIRFHIHSILVDMINIHHAELSRIAIQAYLGLMFNQNNGLSITENANYIDAVVKIMDVKNKDMKIQFEGLKALVTIDYYAPELVTESPKKMTLFPVLRKARKMLTAEYQKMADVPNSSSASNNDNNSDANNAGGGASIRAEEGATSTSPSSPPKASYAAPVPSLIAMNNNGEIEKRELELLLNSKIWAKDKCIIS